MKTNMALLWIECEESCESWCAVNIYDILAVQEKLELQQHRPKPPFSIFKLLSSQDCPMNCCRQETFQDTCFSSKQANIRSQQSERLKLKKVHFLQPVFTWIQEWGKGLKVGFDMQPNGRCMELVLLNPTKAADPQIFWMNLHFDGRKQRQFHFTGSTPQRPICSIPAPYIYPRKDSEKWSKRICVGIFCKCKIFGTEDASNRAVQGTDSHWYIWTHIDLDSPYMHRRHINMIDIKDFTVNATRPDNHYYCYISYLITIQSIHWCHIQEIGS